MCETLHDGRLAHERVDGGCRLVRIPPRPNTGASMMWRCALAGVNLTPHSESELSVPRCSCSSYPFSHHHRCSAWSLTLVTFTRDSRGFVKILMFIGGKYKYWRGGAQLVQHF